MMHLVVSPHLDDAVLGAGQWLSVHPGAVVLTVFAGIPRAADMLTSWDRRSGFANAAEAVATRQAEDRAALSVLGAEPLWLDHVDDQYGEPSRLETLVASLRTVLRRLAPTNILMPLGLFHHDHVLAQRACLQAAHAEGAVTLRAYEDAIYRSLPGRLQETLVRLAHDGVRATPAAEQPTSNGVTAKARALAAYASQRRAFDGTRWNDALRPERYWKLEWQHGD